MLGTLRHSAIVGAAALSALGFAAMSAPASATMITPSGPHDGEPGLYQIMNQFYGAGNWQQIPQESTRSSLAASYTFSFDTRFALDNGAVGYLGQGASTPSTLMTLSGTGMNAVANPVQVSLTMAQTGSSFLLTYTNLTTGITFYSDPTMNPDGAEHLILFSIPNTNFSDPNMHELVMAWKDTLGLGDQDYNDAVIQFTYTTTPVPEPSTLALLGTVLVGWGAARTRRRRA